MAEKARNSEREPDIQPVRRPRRTKEQQRFANLGYEHSFFNDKTVK